MYAAQAPGHNTRVFTAAPANTRKCILATNIAETSITIPGVKYVIDPGKCKEKWFLTSATSGASSNHLPTPHDSENALGLNTLVTRNISQSSAAQRAGRAGREVRNSPIPYKNVLNKRKGDGTLLSTLHRRSI